MLSRIKTLTLVAAIVAVVVLGAATVFAQDSTDPVLPPCLTGDGNYGMGMMGGRGIHMGWDGDTRPMFSAIAEALGIDTATLSSELQSGTTVAELAEEYGVDLASLTTTAHAAMQEHLSELVAAGLLTQEQADARLSYMQERWEQMPMLNGGLGMGMMNGWNGGHHGRGMGGRGSGRGMMGRGG